MTPFKTNQQLQTERQVREERQNAINNNELMRQQANPQDPLLELKINQPSQPSQYPQPNQIYPSAYVPVPNPYYPMATNGMIPWQYTPNNVPIIKKYNISLGGPNGDVTRIADIYEDLLPAINNVITNTFNTIKERMVIHHYIRSMFIKTADGEEMLINGSATGRQSQTELTNLLSHVKLLEINPYHSDRISNNPYKTLPKNFVMYRSCYPIRMNKYNAVECSKSSIGINIRIYLLSTFDESIGSSEHRNQSDIWRELDYYQYVREEIIKPNLSPNFITIHSYYMTKNTGIKFQKFEQLRGHIELANKKIEQINADVRNRLYLAFIIKSFEDDITFLNSFADLVKYNLADPTDAPRLPDASERKQMITQYVDESHKSNLLSRWLDSDKCLVILTEAPTQRLFDWATRTYRVGNGPIKPMVQNGSHEDTIWESVFFQLLIAMLIMFEKQIMFKEFSISSNVYIKDLRHADVNVGMWKYIYEGIEYYVPNYGYLTLIDSNFAELMTQPKLFAITPPTTTIMPRIMSPLLNDKNDQGQIFELCLNKMITTFDPSNFGPEFRNGGGMPPTGGFLNKLSIIHEHLRTISLKYFPTGPSRSWSEDACQKLLKEVREIPICMVKRQCFMMMHSRIGTQVKDQEKTYLSDDFDIQTKKGSIVVRKISPTFFTFAIFLGKNDIFSTGSMTLPMYKILTTDDVIYSHTSRAEKKYVELEVDAGSLVNYYIQPEQSYEPGKQYSTLETYLVSLGE